MTPGIARTFSNPALTKPTRLSKSLWRNRGISKVSSCSRRIPRSVFRRCWKVSRRRPPQINSITARDVSTTISECWNQWLRGPALPRPPARRPSCGAVRDPRSAGVSPKTTAAALALAAEKASTRQSSLSRTAPMVSGTSVSRNPIAGVRTPVRGRAKPASTGSRSELRDQSAASAPAVRTATSFASRARGVNRFAGLTHAISSSAADAQNNDERHLRLAHHFFPQRVRSPSADPNPSPSPAGSINHRLPCLLQRHARPEPRHNLRVAQLGSCASRREGRGIRCRYPARA